ncbi:MAG: DUF89 family protein [Oscillospiraceae bacterium]|nr:DUF89 family protein [Oscillospiraceae bacterium]
MSIPINSLCVQCLFRKRLTLARELGDEEKAMTLARQLMQEIIKAPPEMDSTWMGSICDKQMQELYGLDPDRLKAEKDFSNRFVLERVDEINRRIEESADPVYAALQFAVLGNYLDFSALQGEVSFDALQTMLDGAQEIVLDKECYAQFCKDLSHKRKLLYITDNAGEIVFDRLLAEQLKKGYPHLEITFCVRGKPVSNDATRADAAAAGITFPVIDNGTAIGGTVLRFVGDELKQAMEQADVIIAKGMGNTESLFGCGYNVYYAFLVKCERFIEFFGKPKLTPMFICDRK